MSRGYNASDRDCWDCGAAPDELHDDDCPPAVGYIRYSFEDRFGAFGVPDDLVDGIGNPL
ncbi:hypothetical protein [Streptomonospora litoralis]|uniref:Uncharacterized protein n=1 Tax=Streptomonospora litoralis TaxID=2498135 RepID=A0A4P6Q7Y3_9ACTN|nr:hypothetical protein [Streptomonospora litoralis]QBI56815.1 hypothetical protein EKD16_25375 [Streptomonospora litoralis]